MGQRIRGLKRVGIYVPGGTAAYPSSVLMNAIPAKIAGVEEIVMCTPPMKNGKPNPNILAAAKLAGCALAAIRSECAGCRCRLSLFCRGQGCISTMFSSSRLTLQ